MMSLVGMETARCTTEFESCFAHLLKPKNIKFIFDKTKINKWKDLLFVFIYSMFIFRTRKTTVAHSFPKSSHTKTLKNGIHSFPARRLA